MYNKILFGSGSILLKNNLLQLDLLPDISAKVGRYGDGEIEVQISENLRNQSVLILQPLYSSDLILELLFMIDACKRLGANKVGLIIPYLGYARQDRVFPKSPLSAKVVADLLKQSGIVEILAVDLHNHSLAGFFDIPVNNLYPVEIFANHVDTEDLCIVSPDFGGIPRSQKLLDALGSEVKPVIIDKYRPSPGESLVVRVIGDVQNKNCIIVDDIIDGGSTLCNATNALIENGAKTVKAFVTHGLLSNRALDLVEESSLTELLVTDTVGKITDDLVKTDTCYNESYTSLKGYNKTKIISVASILQQEINFLNKAFKK